MHALKVRTTLGKSLQHAGAFRLLFTSPPRNLYPAKPRHENMRMYTVIEKVSTIRF